MHKLSFICWGLWICYCLTSCSETNTPTPPDPPTTNESASSEPTPTSSFMNMNEVQLKPEVIQQAESLHTWWQKEEQINRQTEEFKVTCDDGKACTVSYYYQAQNKLYSIQIDCKTGEDREIRYYYYKDAKLAIHTTTRFSWVLKKGGDGTPEPSFYNMAYYYFGSADSAIGGARYLDADTVSDASFKKILTEKLNVFEAMDMKEAQSLYDEGNNMSVMLPEMTSPIACGVVAED